MHEAPERTEPRARAGGMPTKVGTPTAGNSEQKRPRCRPKAERSREELTKRKQNSDEQQPRRASTSEAREAREEHSIYKQQPAVRKGRKKKALQGLRGRGREAHTQQAHSKPTQQASTRGATNSHEERAQAKHEGRGSDAHRASEASEECLSRRECANRMAHTEPSVSEARKRELTPLPYSCVCILDFILHSVDDIALIHVFPLSSLHY